MIHSYKKTIKDALKEDLQKNGDITSDCLIKKKHKSIFKLIVKEDAILSGLEVFKQTFNFLDKNIVVDSEFKEGDKIKNNQVVAFVSGNTLAILKGERTALNFICHLSGIATTTKYLVDLLKGTGVKLLDTRKTTPNLRYLEKEAVFSGGGNNHRFTLSDMILIKDNHIAMAGGVKNVLKKVKAIHRNRFKIEIEVKNLKELKEAINSKPDIIMFDNWKVEDLNEAIKLIPSDILTEASGEITNKNILEYARCGVNFISTSYMIKNTRWIDFSLKAG